MNIKHFSLAGLLIVGSAQAQLATVIPNGFTNTSTNGTFLGPLSNANRRYMLIVDSSQLTAHVGRVLNGIAWRNLPTATGAWPTAPVN